MIKSVHNSPSNDDAFVFEVSYCYVQDKIKVTYVGMGRQTETVP